VGQQVRAPQLVERRHHLPYAYQKGY
jgi:hypothetical protein